MAVAVAGAGAQRPRPAAAAACARAPRRAPVRARAGIQGTPSLARTARRQATRFANGARAVRGGPAPRAGPLAVIFNPVTIIIYVFTFIKIWTNIDKTTYDREKRMQLALLWPVLAITNSNFRSALAKMVTS